MAKICD